MTATLERFGQKIDESSLSSTCLAYQAEEKDVGLILGTKRERRRSAMSNTPSPSPNKRAEHTPKKTGKNKIGEARRKICDDDENETENNKIKDKQENFTEQS